MKSIAVIVAFLATLAIGTAQDWGKVYDAMPLYAKVQLCFDSSMPSGSSDRVKCVAKAMAYDIIKGKENVEQALQSVDKNIKDFINEKKTEINQYINSNEFLKEIHDKAHELKGKAKEQVEKVKDWFKEKFGRQKREMPSQALIAKAKQIKACMDKGTDKETCTANILGAGAIAVDLVQLQAVINYEAVLEELKEYFKFKENGGTLKEFIAMKKQQNRPKREMPSQALIAKAKQIKSCMDKGGDKETCTTNILGAGAIGVDLVQLQAVVNYEAVLEELKEYFKFKENGGTLKEFIEMKKKQNRPKRGSFFSVTDVSVVKDVKQCLQENTDKNTFQCVMKVVGSDAVEAKDKLETLLKNGDAKVREYIKAKKQAIHDYIESKGGFLDKLHDKAHEMKEKAKEWFKEIFGKDKVEIVPAATEASVSVSKDKVEILPSATEESVSA